MSSNPKFLPTTSPKIPLLNGNGEPPETIGQMVDKWAGVFEPEFWQLIRDEVRKRRQRAGAWMPEESN
jgi:hypothetical protein